MAIYWGILEQKAYPPVSFALWIQLVSGTVSLKNTSKGVLKARHLHGRKFSLNVACSICLLGTN
jgi:hypothetical protein